MASEPFSVAFQATAAEDGDLGTGVSPGFWVEFGEDFPPI